jgi:hypothetical protein
MLQAQTSELDTHQKTLAINLDPAIYGAFAEIGAGQEIARWFFRVGGAAGTVAKTMSAYDMTVSDAIYGKTQRYVSKERLIAMLNHEYSLLLERLAPLRGGDTTFFAFANTISARSFHGTNQGHGWLGLRFQTTPGGESNDILMHVNLIDRENIAQQEALGIVGVNLIHSAFYGRDHLDAFLVNLVDDLATQRIEIDILEFSGPAFSHINNRIVGLKLLQLGLANALIYQKDGSLEQPSEVVYKRPVLIERGAYRALHKLNIETIDAVRRNFSKLNSTSAKQAVSLIEITVHEDSDKENLSYEDTLKRIDLLTSTGDLVIVSKFHEFYNLTTYLRRYTNEPLGFVMGISTLVRIINTKYYDNHAGKMLEGIGSLFSFGVELHSYPMAREVFAQRMREEGVDISTWIPKEATVVDLNNISLPTPLNSLFTFLRSNGFIKGVGLEDIKGK